MHFDKRERSALWLNAMHSGKKWWIREFVPPYIFPLDPDMLLLAPYGRSTAINYGKWCPCSGIRSPLHFCSCSVSGSCSHSRSYSEFRFPAFPDAHRELVSVLPSLPWSQFKFGFRFRFRFRFRLRFQIPDSGFSIRPLRARTKRARAPRPGAHQKITRLSRLPKKGSGVYS